MPATPVAAMPLPVLGRNSIGSEPDTNPVRQKTSRSAAMDALHQCLGLRVCLQRPVAILVPPPSNGLHPQEHAQSRHGQLAESAALVPRIPRRSCSSLIRRLVIGDGAGDGVVGPIRCFDQREQLAEREQTLMNTTTIMSDATTGWPRRRDRRRSYQPACSHLASTSSHDVLVSGDGSSSASSIGKILGSALPGKQLMVWHSSTCPLLLFLDGLHRGSTGVSFPGTPTPCMHLPPMSSQLFTLAPATRFWI